MKSLIVLTREQTQRLSLSASRRYWLLCVNVFNSFPLAQSGRGSSFEIAAMISSAIC
jgi:hypothetical protein